MHAYYIIICKYTYRYSDYTVHTSYNLNVTRVYHACVDHEMHTRFCYTRVLSCNVISYTTNTLENTRGTCACIHVSLHTRTRVTDGVTCVFRFVTRTPSLKRALTFFQLRPHLNKTTTLLRISIDIPSHCYITITHS